MSDEFSLLWSLQMAERPLLENPKLGAIATFGSRHLAEPCQRGTAALHQFIPECSNFSMKRLEDDLALRFLNQIP